MMEQIDYYDDNNDDTGDCFHIKRYIKSHQVLDPRWRKADLSTIMYN